MASEYVCLTGTVSSYLEPCCLELPEVGLQQIGAGHAQQLLREVVEPDHVERAVLFKGERSLREPGVAAAEGEVAPHDPAQDRDQLAPELGIQEAALLEFDELARQFDVGGCDLSLEARDSFLALLRADACLRERQRLVLERVELLLSRQLGVGHAVECQHADDDEGGHPADHPPPPAAADTPADSPALSRRPLGAASPAAHDAARDCAERGAHPAEQVAELAEEAVVILDLGLLRLDLRLDGLDLLLRDDDAELGDLDLLARDPLLQARLLQHVRRSGPRGSRPRACP